jgi:hypothetical protein
MKGSGNFSGIRMSLAYLHEAIAEKKKVNKNELSMKASV